MLYDDDDKNTRTVKLLGEHFIARRDVKAIQTDDGGWMPVREDSRDTGSPFLPWSMMDFRLHLNGDRTFGHYMLNTDDTCKLFAFDLDVMEPHPARGKEGELTFQHPDIPAEDINPRAIWQEQDVSSPAYESIRFQLRCLAESLALAIDRRLEIEVAVCDTGGKGLHVYGFTGSQPASVCRELAVGILDGFAGQFTPSRGTNFYRHTGGGYPYIEIEVFPKQTSLDGKDLGNLMALPCGINRKTNRWRDFVTFRGLGYEQGWRPLDQVDAMEGAKPWD